MVGFNKLMWGSDYPRTMTAITYKMSLDFIEKTNEISEEHKRLILGENVRAFYNFTKLPQPREIRNMVEDYEAVPLKKSAFIWPSYHCYYEKPHLHSLTQMGIIYIK